MAVAIKVQKGVDISTKGFKSFGMNPHHITNYNAYRFINIMKHAADWNDMSVVDANGYPDQAGTFESAFHTGTQSNHSGYYKITWDGDGSLTVNAGAAWTNDSSGANWRTGWLDGSIGVATWVIVTNVGAQRVTNIKIIRQEETNAANPGGVHPGHQEAYDAGKILIPDDSIYGLYSTYETLRMMWWNTEPSLDHSDWDALPLDPFTYRTHLNRNSDWRVSMVPYAVFAQICNEIQANPWVSVPHDADDYYITELAKVFRDNLDANLIPKFEFSNEVWNPDYSAYDCRWYAWADGWTSAESETDLEWVEDFSGWTAVGCSIGGDGVTITEDTSTGEHYIETTLTYSGTPGGGNGKALILLLDSTDAPGVRLYQSDGSNTGNAIFNMATTKVQSSSGPPSYDPAQIRDQGAYTAMWTNRYQSDGSGRVIRIQFTDGSFATSYTGTGKEMVLRRASVQYQTCGIYPHWYAYRSAQMKDLIKAQFDVTGRAYRTILAWQAKSGSPGATLITQASEWQRNESLGWSERPRTWQEAGQIHEILSCATYMGNYNINGIGGVFSQPNCRAMWDAWVAGGGDVDPEDPAAYTALKETIVLDTAGVKSGFLAEQAEDLKSYISAFAAVARSQGMRLEAYEGGNHCLLASNVTNPLWNATTTGTTATLENTINDSVLSFTILGDVTGSFDSTGVVKIDSEFLTYTGRSFDGTRTTFTVSYRGEKLSTAASHTAGATVTKCTYSGTFFGADFFTIFYEESDVADLWDDVLDHWRSETTGTWCQLTDVMKGGTGDANGWFGIRREPGIDNVVSDRVDAWLAANPRWWIT